MHVSLNTHFQNKTNTYHTFVKKTFKALVMQTKYEIVKTDWGKIYLNKVGMFQD